MSKAKYVGLLIFALSAVGFLLPDSLHAAPPAMTARDAVVDGMAWLKADQNPSGSWGDPLGSGFRDTTVAVDALQSLGEQGAEYDAGVNFLQFTPTNNNDYLARQTTALAGGGRDVSAQLTSLLGSQNSVEFDNTRPNFPEGGWGIAPGYSTSTLDTALALEALNAAGKAGGLTVKDETIGPGVPDIFQFQVPSTATSVTITVTALSGEITLRTKEGSPPTLSDPATLINFAPSQLGPLAAQPGTNYLRIDSSLVSTYSLEVSIAVVELSVTGQAIAPALPDVFQFEVPAGAIGFNIIITNLTGEIELRTEAGSPPSLSDPPFRINSSPVSILISPAVVGTNYIRIDGVVASTYSLEVTIETGLLTVPSEPIAPGETDVFQFDLPTGATSMNIIITDLVGEIDFRIKRDNLPTLADPFFHITSAPAPLGGLPITAGTYHIRIDTSVAATYSFEVSFDATELTVVADTVAPTQPDTFQFDVPVGATDADVVITALIGEIDFRINKDTPPTLADPFFRLNTAPVGLTGFFAGPGTYHIRVDPTVAGTYSFEASYEAISLTVQDQIIDPGAGAGADTFQFELPGDVTDLSVAITDLTGEINFRIKQGSPPTLADPFFNITTAPLNLSGITVTPGTYFIRVDSSVSSIYSFEVTFVAGGFDTRNLLTALNYLASAQNPDGGWGISVGSDSNVFLTARVLQSLEGSNNFFDVQTQVDGGINWLLTQQNADGGFGSSPSTVYATSLAYLAIAGQDRQSPEAQNALDYILANQQADGSWDSDAYTTALALQALALTKIQLIPLHQAWNLISFSVNNCYYDTASPPGVPLLADVECIQVSNIGEAFSSIDGKYEVVRSFDINGAHTFDPALPLFSDLRYVSSGYGYWIKMTEPAVLRLVGDRAEPNSVLSLSQNWNLVGFWGSTNCWYDSASPPLVPLPADVTNCTPLVSIGEAFDSINGLYDVIRSFDETGAHTFDPALPLFSDLHYVAPGYGIWIKMNGTADLSYPPPP